MNRFRTAFNREEVDILQSLVGAEWISYGGSTFVFDGKFAVGDMFIESSAGTVTIAADLVECPFPTGPEVWVARRVVEQCSSTRRVNWSLVFQSSAPT